MKLPAGYVNDMRPAVKGFPRFEAIAADRGVATQAVRNTHEAWASATTTA
jgi:hypothetical protein